MSIPKYIVNFNELAELLNGRLSPNIDASDGALKDLFETILEQLLPIAGVPPGDLSQCSIGLHSYIPALAFDYELIHVFEYDVFLSGISYSQTGWKVSDTWSLYAGDVLLFDGLFTKELGEYKHFNIFREVCAGTEIKLVYHNNSGNSKQLWFDIDYLAETHAEPPPSPEPVLTMRTGSESE